MALVFEAGLKPLGRSSVRCSDLGHISRSGTCKLKDKGVSHLTGLQYLRSHQEVDLKLRYSQLEKSPVHMLFLIITETKLQCSW